jgi:hypothetical protein
MEAYEEWKHAYEAYETMKHETHDTYRLMKHGNMKHEGNMTL